MTLECSNTLKKIGVDLLCLFLNTRNKNSIFLALRLLDQISTLYKEEVNKNIRLIQRCILDKDTGVRDLSRGIMVKISSEFNYKDNLAFIINILSN